jgi:apolipoprotein D and lipocalin family protein
MAKMTHYTLCSVIWIALFGCATSETGTRQNQTVDKVDLKRYAGKWYEIASFPAWFQRDCYCATAEYTEEKDYIFVRNTCRKGSPEGPPKMATAKAFPVPGSGNAKLKVQFQWPFKGDYWIIALDEDYRYAMVGHPGKKYLWILSRTPAMEKATYLFLVRIAESKGYDVSRLKRADQACLAAHP